MWNKWAVLIVATLSFWTFGLSQADAQITRANLKTPPRGWHWRSLTLEADFPQPFGKVVIVVKQSKSNYAPKITGISVAFNGQKVIFKKRLLKNLILSDDPEIGYNTQKGKITSLFILFEYGYPVKHESGCPFTDCTAMPVATFVIDKKHHVTRKNSFNYLSTVLKHPLRRFNDKD